jgi:hypothetical protein
VPADHGCAKQLASSRFFLGAGVPDDGEHTDQGDDDRNDAHPPRGEPADARVE